jgi:hypothetical protein
MLPSSTENECETSDPRGMFHVKHVVPGGRLPVDVSRETLVIEGCLVIFLTA